MMQKKLRQTSFAVILIVLITFGIILLLQNLVNIEEPLNTKSPTSPPTAVVPDTNPNNGTGGMVSDVVLDSTKLNPEEKCALMEDSDGKLNCYDNIILKEVLASNMLLACDDLQYDPNIEYCQDVFYKNKALLDNDIEFCDSIKDDYVKTQCQDALLIRKSAEKMSFEECENITEISQKNSCIDKVRLKTAITNGESTQCQLLQDETLKELCVTKATKQATSDNYAQALESGNLTLCNNLKDNLKGECQDEVNYNIGVSENNPTACTNILETLKKEECLFNVYISIAKEEESPKSCLKIENSEKVTECEQGVNVALLKRALTQNDIKKCDTISDATLKQKCLDSF